MVNLIRTGWTGLRKTLKDQPTEDEDVRGDIPMINLILEGWAGLKEALKEPDPPKD